MRIIVGDSHATFFEKVGIMESHWMGPTHTATIFQLLKLGLELDKLQEALRASDHFVNVGVPKWKCPDGVYNTPNIKSGDTVFFSYGYNDMQKNIYLHAKENPEVEIDRLLYVYIELLNGYQAKYGIKCVVCSIPPNPAPREGGNGKFDYGIGGEFRAEGPDTDRDFYTRHANRKLKQLCTIHGMDFVDLYNGMYDKDGFLLKQFTTDYVHLTETNPELIDRMRSIIESVYPE